MPPVREVKTCDRCRHFKRRCDLLKPSCSRCIQAGVTCSFDTSSTAASAPNRNGSHEGAGKQKSSGKADSAESFIANVSQLSSNGMKTASNDTDSVHGRHRASSSSESEGEDAPADEPADGKRSSGTRVVRKRKRNCLSCLRCHRLKVKCDKELPCGRCKTSGNARECYYSYNKGRRNEGKFPSVAGPVGTGDDEKTISASWQVQHKVRGSSHWRDLMAKILTLTSADTQPLVKALEAVAANACLANFYLPGNFPFGTPGASKYFARDTVVRLVASERHNIPGYIDMYFKMLDCVNPIVDEGLFRAEVEEYWEDPHSTNICWLAQFLMVIALGCFCSSDEPPMATELLMAAESCLMQTPFMFRPNLLTIKTFCLCFVAKQVCNATCWASDSAWSMMGLLIRSAHIYGLPQDRVDVDDGASEQELDTRRRLWLTILYLDIKGAIATGMSPLTKPEELGKHFEQTPNWGPSDRLQMVLHQALPIVLTVVGHLNSKTQHISYPDVLRYNAQLRELMAHAQKVCGNAIQRITVDIFLRRCLMVLQRPFALHSEGPVMFPESYWSSLECGLALLMHYRDLWCNDMGLRLDLVGRAFVLDFFSATLTTYVHLLREDAPLTLPTPTSCAIPPRQIILDTLFSCVEIWQGEREKSVCYKTGYDLLDGILALLPQTAGEGP